MTSSDGTIAADITHATLTGSVSRPMPSRSTVAIELADGTIAADITHAAVAADPARKVDGTLVLPPTVTSVYVDRRPEDGLAYRLGEEIRARAEFDSAIEVTGRPQLALTIGTTTRQATYSRIWGKRREWSSSTRCRPPTWTPTGSASRPML